MRLDRGETIHKLDTAGGYMEIDTTEDYELARRHWPADFTPERT